MGDLINEFDFAVRLEAERPHLVRLCLWFTGKPDAAEDLAQETLLAAWQNQAQLRAPEKLRAWLHAIARSAWLSWTRKNSREQARTSDAAEEKADQVQDPASLELDLERAELARLLEQALALLPAQTARLLVEHYMQGYSQAEIAEKRGLNAGTVAVRLQRGKLSLRRLLQSRFEVETRSFDLPLEKPLWEETNIWCPTCGRGRLLGQFRTGTADARFLLRCPHCHPESERILVGHDLTMPYYSGILGSIKSYKPAYNRLLTGLAPLYRQALDGQPASCLACGRPAVMRVDHADSTASLSARAGSQVLIQCSVCDWATNISLSGLVMTLPEALRFWRDHPRLQTLPAEQIERQGVLAYVTRIQSLPDAAEITVISRRDTLAPIDVFTNVRL